MKDRQARRLPAILMAIASVCTAASPPLPAADPDPAAFVESAMNGLFEAIERDRTAIETDPQVAKAVIRENLTPHFDLERTCRWVLGKHWRAASGDQQDQMVEEFRTLLISVYAAAITDFSNLSMKYLDAEPVGGDDDVSVRVEASNNGGKPIILTYRVHRGETAQWKVYDVVVDGVSLVTTYRSTFAATIRESGMDGLIERLREKNAAS